MSASDVIGWLEKLGLGELKSTFEANGYDDPECIKDINESDLVAMQIDNESPAFPEIIEMPAPEKPAAEPEPASEPAPEPQTSADPEPEPEPEKPKVPIVIKLEDGTPCIIHAPTDITAKQTVEMVIMESKCQKKNAAHAWRIFEVYQVPPIERLLHPEEKLMTTMHFWPKIQDAPWFELRELPSEIMGVAATNYKGALDKRGGSYKSWKSRHMRCVGQELHYFKSEPKNLKQFDNPVGKWFFGDAIIFSVRHLAKAPHSDLCICIKPVADPMWPTEVKQIVDVFENGCKFLSAGSEVERANWIASLSMGMADLEKELEKVSPMIPKTVSIKKPKPALIDNPLGIKPAVEQPDVSALVDAFVQRPQSKLFLDAVNPLSAAKPEAAKPPPPGAKPKPPAAKPLPDKPQAVGAKPQPAAAAKPLPPKPPAAAGKPLPPKPPAAKPLPNIPDHSQQLATDVIDCDTYESTYEVCDDPPKSAASQPKPPKLPQKPVSAAAANAAAVVSASGMAAGPGEGATDEEILKYRRTTMVKQVPKAHDLPEDPMKWDSSDVLRWLKLNELEDFRSKFYSNGFEGSQLLALSAASFKKLGFGQDRCDALSNAINCLRVSYTQWKRGQTAHVNPKATTLQSSQDATQDATYGTPQDTADAPMYGMGEEMQDPPENPEAIYGDHEMESQNPPEVAGEIYGDPNPPSSYQQEAGEELYGDVDAGLNPNNYPEPSEELYGDANTPNYPAPSDEIYGEADEPAGGEELYGDTQLPPPDEAGEELYGDVSAPDVGDGEPGEELYGDVNNLPPPSEEIYGDASGDQPSGELYMEQPQSEEYNVMPNLYKVSDEPTYINQSAVELATDETYGEATA